MASISSENIRFKKSKIINMPKNSQVKNLEQITIIQNLTKENSQLKEALADLEKDLKEKDQSIEESHKKINKLKDEYSKVIKEFELMENSYNELLDEYNQKTIEISEAKKTQSMMNVLINKNNNDLSVDNRKLLYKQNVINKKKILSCGDVKQKNEKSKLKDMNEIIRELKKKNLICIKMIKDKDSVIEKQNIKIQELNDIINAMNKNKINEKNFENIFNNKNASLSLVNLLNEKINQADNLKDEIPEDLSINNNFKNELMKTELFSSLIRETHFRNFIQKLLEKMNISKLIHIYQYCIENKNNYINIMKENHLLKNSNRILYDNLSELKNQININNKKVKNKCINLIENINKKDNISNKIKKINEIRLKNNNNFKDNNIFKLKEKIFNSHRILNNLPNSEKNDMDELKKSETNIISKDSLNKIKKINNTLIKTTLNRPKNRILKYKNIDTDIILKNKSLQFEPHNTDGNFIQDKFNSTNISLASKTHKNPNINNSYKNNIFNLQKEFNSIISKSVAQDNIYNSSESLPKNDLNYFKISNLNNSKKNLTNNNKNELIKKESDTGRNIKVETKKNTILHNSFFSYDFFINLLFKTNEGIFMKEELDKYNQIYNLTNYENIFLTFKKTCNELKIMTDEMNLKINKTHNLNESNLLNKSKIDNVDQNKDIILDGSFKVFNERILKLKKLEFEFINMNEYIKCYLISQEATIKLMYKERKRNAKFEPIDKLFNLFEDCLSYRINEMNENIKFNRKLLIKLFKNQINCLFLSFEYKFK